MLAFKTGDAKASSTLVSRHRGPVYNFILRYVGHRQRAEDVLQETWLKVVRGSGQWQPTAKFTTWLFRIASHLAINWLRDRKMERLQDSLDSPPEGQTIQLPDKAMTKEQEMLHSARMAEVRAAIQGLPPKQRAAVLMHKYQEMGYSQIAKVFQCSESAVKSLLFRAYETLRARLAHMG